jgi:hypothetical protein
MLLASLCVFQAAFAAWNTQFQQLFSGPVNESFVLGSNNIHVCPLLSAAR